MSGIPISFRTAEIQLGDISPKTILQVYGATGTGRGMIREISLSVNDVPNLSKSLLVQVVRQTTAGSGLITSNGVLLNQDDTYVPKITGSEGKASGQVEPTSTTVIMSKYIPTLGGEFLWLAVRETDKIPLNADERIGLLVTSTVGAAYKVIAYIILEE